MNFLAHLYLSGDDDDVALGNFISDSVKGMRAVKKFPEKVALGIILHRKIDEFMDSHPLVLKGAGRLRDKYGRYSPIIMDMFYDYFLASGWNMYSETPLDVFIQDKYNLIEQNWNILPNEVKQMFPYMKEANWLLTYRTLEGMGNILTQMDRRFKGRSGMSTAILELEQFHPEYEEEFTIYMQEISLFVNEYLEKHR